MKLFIFGPGILLDLTLGPQVQRYVGSHNDPDFLAMLLGDSSKEHKFVITRSLNRIDPGCPDMKASQSTLDLFKEAAGCNKETMNEFKHLTVSTGRLQVYITPKKEVNWLIEMVAPKEWKLYATLS